MKRPSLSGVMGRLQQDRNIIKDYFLILPVTSAGRFSHPRRHGIVRRLTARGCEYGRIADRQEVTLSDSSAPVAVRFKHSNSVAGTAQLATGNSNRREPLMSDNDTATVESLTDQLDREKRAVSYDVYDMTVRQLVDMVTSGEIDIAPEYQRHFVWDAERESELIESIYLGIPVPSLYMAANRDGTWEVVDGVQRLSTLVHFCGDSASLKRIDRTAPLELTDLKKLTAFNGKTFEALPKPTQLNFLLRPVRVTTLNDKSDSAVRYDLFERLNTGGVKLHPQEIRNCVFRGDFRDTLKNLADDANFQKV
jgi:hypothetical protein